ncbi:hypothetical protein [Desulfonispora thiosulfatigenes]|nr:hypothetical protein [Desulfonispora thiosulfatigenes]
MQVYNTFREERLSDRIERLKRPSKEEFERVENFLNNYKNGKSL